MRGSSVDRTADIVAQSQIFQYGILRPITYFTASLFTYAAKCGNRSVGLLKECLLAKKRNKITVLLDTEEFERFDKYCEKRGYKKSTLIARLIREHLDGRAFHLQRDLSLAERQGGSQ